MEEDKVGIFSKALNWKPLLLHKIKIKQNPGCPIKECNAIFENIHQDIRVSQKQKKICIDQSLWKHHILERVRAKRGLFQQVWFVPNTFEGFECQCHPRKVFYYHLSLETVSPALKQDCYINMNISFSWEKII